MGVDYYIYKDLYIIFNDGKLLTITLGREGHYYSCGISPHDSDSEGDNERAIEEYENKKYVEISRNNSQKNVFQNGEWLITSGIKIDEYTRRIKEELAKKAKAESVEIAREAFIHEYDETFVGQEPKWQKYLSEFPNSVKTIIKSVEGIQR
jgi:hypothetical protein